MAKKDKKPLKAAQWFGIADQFGRGSFMLAKYTEQTGDGSHVLVDLTARAFATEAYLKSLLTIRRRKFPQVHDLERLFGLLPPADQEFIRTEWDKYTLPIVVSAATASDRPKALPIIRDFEEALKASKDAFIEWRYETHLLATWYMGNFPLFVRNRILRSRPRWEQSPPNLFGKFPKSKFGK